MRLQRNMHGVDGIFKLERIEVMNEIGLTNGVWFKCYKGHYFCAKECGTTTDHELSECPRCKL